MKNILVQIVRIFLYPLIYCHRIIMEAPVIGCNDDVVGYAEYTRFTMEDDIRTAHRPSYAKRTASLGETGWVCQTR